jgi:hypothetical protein
VVARQHEAPHRPGRHCRQRLRSSQVARLAVRPPPAQDTRGLPVAALARAVGLEARRAALHDLFPATNHPLLRQPHPSVAANVGPHDSQVPQQFGSSPPIGRVPTSASRESRSRRFTPDRLPRPLVALSSSKMAVWGLQPARLACSIRATAARAGAARRERPGAPTLQQYPPANQPAFKWAKYSLSILSATRRATENGVIVDYIERWHRGNIVLA